MKTLFEIKLRKARIDTERIQAGLDPIYGTSEKELNAKQAKIHNDYAAKETRICRAFGIKHEQYNP